MLSLFLRSKNFKPPKIVRVEARRLQCNDPVVQRRWIQLYKQKIQDHKVMQKQYQLERTTYDKMTPQQKEE